jgi:hypothetical protein
MNSVSFITLTNKAYVPLTLNCIRSLEMINTSQKLCCYCIDKDSFLQLTDNYDPSLVYMVPDIKYICSDLPKFRQQNWNKVVINKFNIIYDNLQNYEYVLFTDGDIVYEKDGFVEYCIEKIEKNNVDMLIQNDSANDSICDNLCSGFMFIKSCEKTKKFFNPDKIDISKFECDQIYINHNYKKFNITLSVLPVALFPNGGYYKKHQDIKDNYLIHFNWCGGENKIRWMKNCNKWVGEPRFPL